MTKHIAKPWIMGLTMYEPGRPIEVVAREHGFDDVEEIIKLASNENALGPSPKAMRAMKKAASKMHLYPDSGAYCLRHALAERLKVKPEQLLIACGSNEIIEFIGHVFLEQGVDVVIADRAFAIFRLVADLFQAHTIVVPMKDYTHDLDAMLNAITPRTRVVFIANPNNPTGTMVSSKAIERFMNRVPDHVVVCMDEAYIELLPPRLQPDTIRYVHEGRNIIIMRTFSKSYGLAGLRIGYGIAPEICVQLMHRVRQPFSVNAMAQEAAVAALDDDRHLRKTRRMIKQGLEFFETNLPKLNLPFVPSVANFMMVDVGEGRKVFHALEREQVIVRPLDGYGLPRHVRISVGTQEENIRCVQALAKVLGVPSPV